MSVKFHPSSSLSESLASEIHVFQGSKNLPPVCPSLFALTAAQDGQLVRLRIPGGVLSSQQCRVNLLSCDRNS